MNIEKVRRKLRGAGFQTCRAADFQVGSAAWCPASLETRDTAGLEVCAPHIVLSPFFASVPDGAGRKRGGLAMAFLSERTQAGNPQNRCKFLIYNDLRLKKLVVKKSHF
jgi:hypothetical protein